MNHVYHLIHTYQNTIFLKNCDKRSENIQKNTDIKNDIYICTGQLVLTMANLEGDETFEASMLGAADEIVQERICDDELILIKG